MAAARVSVVLADDDDERVFAGPEAAALPVQVTDIGMPPNSRPLPGRPRFWPASS